MSTSHVDLRELRRHASDLVRRAKSGEVIDITTAGRVVARLVPAARRRWQQSADIARLFAGPGDPRWEDDRTKLDQSLVDPRAPR